MIVRFGQAFYQTRQNPRPYVKRFSRHGRTDLFPSVIYAGMDMGTTNTTFVVTEHTGRRIKVLYADMIPPHVLIRDFKEDGFLDRISAFQDYIERMIRRFQPSVLIGELFFLRGFRTNLGTPINFMLGSIAALCRQHGTTFLPINAGTWKGFAWLKQIMDVKDLYPYHPVKHLIDGCLLSLSGNKNALETLTKPDLIRLIKSLPMPTVSTALRHPKKKKKAVKATPSNSRKTRKRKKTKPSPSAP